MKKTILLLAMIVVSICVLAQSPQMFNYQAVVRDAQGTPIMNDNVEIQINILSSTIDGDVVFTETHNTITNDYGLINLKIGSQNDMSVVDWTSDAYFIEVVLDGTQMGVSQLLSVPFAMHAATAGNVFSGNYEDLSGAPNLDIYLTDITTGSLGDLADVDLTGLSDNQILKYNATTEKWTAIDVAAASETDPVFVASEAANVTDAGSGVVITDVERTKLAGIQEGAEQNVNPDWNAVAGDAQILNKPSLSTVATTGSYNDLSDKPAIYDGTWDNITGKPLFETVATSGDYNDLSNKPTTISASQANAITENTAKRTYPLVDETKLAGIQEGAEQNVNPDWNAVAGDAQILNKPALSTVATSGSYNDLGDKPAIFDGTWDNLTGKPNFADVATSGNYDDLSNKPTTISIAQANEITANTAKRTYPLVDETKLAGIEEGAEQNVNPDWNAVAGDAQILNKPSLSTVATTGSYNDLSDKPAIFDGTWDNITGKPLFETVATSGDYNDLNNTPNMSLYATKDMNSENITNLADPIAEQDAATKSYADMRFQILLNYMVESGADVEGLMDAGVTVEELVEAEASIADLIANGAGVEELFNLGVCVGTLRDNGAAEADLIAAGLVGTVSDFEGNSYEWVKIGTQIWMAENLRSTKYSDGTEINPFFPSTFGYYAYANDPANIPVYGYLYNMEAFSNGEPTSDAIPSGFQGACPSGWHVPSDGEWDVLEDFLVDEAYMIDESNVGKALASKNLWTSSATEGHVGNDMSTNNASGFNALPGGTRNAATQAYSGKGQKAYFYSSSWYHTGWPDYDDFVKNHQIDYNKSVLTHGYQRFSTYSVRCVKD
ncbi:MAG: fibrobacter succinogenes major paralogous domain-containing protein [Bacteroidales bacterium]|nr:fibrobacter succinogenes major paralogous domain-containing protein [Bacteroidales bacterium]